MRRSIVRELVIGFGFLNGVWLAIGTSPEDLVYNFLKPYVTNLPTILRTIFSIIPIILILLTAYTIFKTYQSGRVMGIIAVFLAFIAGGLIFKNWIATLILLAIALIIGAISFRGRR
jgi:hypothetical protein